MNNQIQKAELDVSKIFLSYITAAGDVLLTAQMAGCRPDEVIFLATSELWDKKLDELKIVRGKGKEETAAQNKELNRMACYVQAVRLCALVDKTLKWVYENDENISKFAQETNKQGQKVYSTKPILDLVKAAESCHAMLYRSLGDSAKGAESLDGSGTMSGFRELHLHVVEALQNTPGALPIDQMKRVNPLAAAVDTTSGYLDADSALSDAGPGQKVS